MFMWEVGAREAEATIVTEAITSIWTKGGLGYCIG
jgi:hypothetical protein